MRTSAYSKSQVKHDFVYERQMEGDLNEENSMKEDFAVYLPPDKSIAS